MPSQTAPNPPSAGPRTVFLETFGCQMNVLDSQLVRGQLLGLGYRFIDRWEEADVILYNTCSVREHAEQKVYSRLGWVALHKRERPEVVVGVIGCMAEREGLDLARRFRQVDVMCGPGELDKLPMLIDNVLRTSLDRRGGKRAAQAALQGNNHRRSTTLAAAEDELELLDLARSFSPDEHQGSAYVRITRGCNKFCTYCVVPNTRGREVHRSPDAIVEECRKLVDSGVIEITLIGQTVNHYHYDHGAAVQVNGVAQPQIGATVGADGPRIKAGSRVTAFADLLYRIHEEVPDLARLRFVTNFPRDFGDDILHVMRACPRICRYLHLPVQSGSNRILKLMNRGYVVEEYLELLDRARAALPDVQIASDLICGFPTETQADHDATCELTRKARWKNAFIFKYSPRPGTAAIERFTDDVPDDVKRQRNNELLAIQSVISREVHEACVGKCVRVFVESVTDRRGSPTNAADPAVELRWQPTREVTQLSGRTDGDLIVLFEGDPSVVGTIVEVEIRSAAALSLFGSQVNEAIQVP